MSRLLERPAGEGLHAPGRLAEAADLPGEEADVAHATSSSAACERPRRAIFSRAIDSGTNCRSPFGLRETPAGFRASELPRKAAKLSWILERGAPRVDDAGHDLLRVAGGDGIEARGVEVHPDRLHACFGELRQHRAGVTEGQLQGERDLVGQLGQGADELRNVSVPGHERIDEDDQGGALPCVRLDLRREDVRREGLRRDGALGSAREGVGRRQAREPASSRKVRRGNRVTQARLTFHEHGAEERVRVQEAREWARSEALRAVDQGSKVILPLEEPVRDQREAGLLLDGDELFGVRSTC